MFERDKLYSFSIYGNMNDGPNYSGVRFLNNFNYETACMFDTIDHIATQMMKFIPEETPRDFRKYDYFQFEDRHGNKFMVANWWIKPGTIKELEGLSYTITIQESNPEQMKRIMDELRVLDVKFRVE